MSALENNVRKGLLIIKKKRNEIKITLVKNLSNILYKRDFTNKKNSCLENELNYRRKTVAKCEAKCEAE